jgi:hypothetical protein
MEKLLEPVVDVEEICKIPWFNWKKNMSEVVYDDFQNIYKFVGRAIFSIIVFIENGDDHQLIERALLNAEQAMRTYEHKCGFIDHGSPLQIKYAGQLRYRTSFYLYGGMFFQRQGRHDCAIDWYLKDINSPELPTVFSNYFVDMKTTERVISAYSLTTNKEMQSNLRDLINCCLVQTTHDTAKCYREVQEYLRSHPLTDMRTVFIRPKGNLRWYGGEATREVYFLSLLYNKFILGTDYGDIDYARFFEY